MMHLIRKDLYLNRLLLWIAGILGIGMVPLCIAAPPIGLFAAVFYQFVLAHMVFNLGTSSRPKYREDQLLISLPIGRDRIVSAKYAYCALWAVGQPLYLSLLLALAKLLGLSVPIPLLNVWLLLSLVGMIFFSVMLPVSFFNVRYASLISLLMYLAALILPQNLPKWFAAGKENKALADGLVDSVSSLPPLVLPITLTCLALLYWGSMKLSQSLYRRLDV